DESGPCAILREAIVPADRLRFPDAPWIGEHGIRREVTPHDADSQGMQIKIRRLSIADAVRELKNAPDPEAEIERRRRLFDESLARVAQQRADQKDRETAERQRLMQYKADRPKRWAALPREQQ